jgi:hypothetical protein
MGLRRLESRMGSVVSVSGSFWGARREVCEKWHPNFSSDFFVPLHAVAQGFRAVVDPECRARFGILRSDREEFRRKVRTVAHGLEVLFSHLALLNPIRYGVFALQLASHKLFRWLLPYALAVLLVSNVFLWKLNPFYQLTLVLQLLGYGVGLLGLALGRRLGLRQLKLAGFFLMGNAATVVAWRDFLLGVNHVIWEPTRRA